MQMAITIASFCSTVLQIFATRFCIPACILILCGVLCFDVNAVEIRNETWKEPVFGGEVFVRQAGMQNQQLLILIHGLGDEAGETWQELIPKLAVDYHVVVPDLPGFGRSTSDSQLYSPQKYAEFLAWFISRLPPKPLSLVGHSLGGAVALFYASEYPESLSRLVLVDAVGLLHRLAIGQHFVREYLQFEPPFSSALDNAPGRIANLVLEKISRLPLDPGYLLTVPPLREGFLGKPDKIAALALVETDFSLRLDLVQTPTWLLWGTEDSTAPVRIADLLRWRLPQAEIRLFQGQGHVPMKDDVLGFLAVLRDCLNKLPSQRNPLQPAKLLTNRVLKHAQDQVISGSYNNLRIESSKNLELRNLWARHLEIIDSRIILADSTIAASNDGPAIKATRSSIVMTGVDLSGKIGILSNQSRLDLAGTEYRGNGKAIHAEGKPSSVLFSCSKKRHNGHLTPLHLSRTLRAGEDI